MSKQEDHDLTVEVIFEGMACTIGLAPEAAGVLALLCARRATTQPYIMQMQIVTNEAGVLLLAAEAFDRDAQLLMLHGSPDGLA